MQVSSSVFSLVVKITLIVAVCSKYLYFVKFFSGFVVLLYNGPVLHSGNQIPTYFSSNVSLRFKQNLSALLYVKGFTKAFKNIAMGPLC
jgi:hypothetical protein